MLKKNHVPFVTIALLAVLASFFLLLTPQEKSPSESKKKKILWLIPDGLRAEPDLFTIYSWAQAGDLPNIKKMMEKGSYGYSIPTFPSHTPTNFATLFTGTYPTKHGVADGPMREEGASLKNVSVGGFSSTAKWNEPIWRTFEEQGYKVTLLSLPGSTPPEVQFGNVIRGRWGGWGADFHALNFQSHIPKADRVKLGRGTRLFFFGPQLTRYLPFEKLDSKLKNRPKSFSPILTSTASGWGYKASLYIYDSTNDNITNYDKISFSNDTGNTIADLSHQEWSAWVPAKLKWKGSPIDSHVKFHIISLHPSNGHFKVRILFDNLNSHITEPSHIASDLQNGVGPMVDFVDNFPPQLIYTQDDKQTFVAEANQSLLWHRKAARYIIDEFKPDLFIQDTYTPNQMLTSRWWMGSIDPKSIHYDKINKLTRKALWDEVKDMYKKVDAILGEHLKNADEDTYVILSSDHGATPLNYWVRVNNLLAKKGWLKFKIDPKNGEPNIDWKNSKAIYLKMNHIFIHPDGIDGKWTRASGKAYEKLRNQVRQAMLELKDKNGVHPTVKALTWEEAIKELKLPKERIGDLVVVNKPGYGWNEEMSHDLKIFDTPLKTGYKQAVIPEQLKDMWTPFVIVGPGIKAGHQIKKPIRHVDQYRTILHLTGLKSSNKLDGRVLKEIIE